MAKKLFEVSTAEMWWNLPMICSPYCIFQLENYSRVCHLPIWPAYIFFLLMILPQIIIKTGIMIKSMKKNMTTTFWSKTCIFFPFWPFISLMKSKHRISYTFSTKLKYWRRHKVQGSLVKTYFHLLHLTYTSISYFFLLRFPLTSSTWIILTIKYK